MQHRQDSALAVAINDNNKEEVERLLKEDKKLETERDISVAFSDPKKITAEVLELVDLYHGLPQDISINTLIFVLRLYGNKSVQLKDGTLINLMGCPGLKSPMFIFVDTGNLEGVQFLIDQGIRERPLFHLFRRVYGLHPLFQIFENYSPSGMV
jgi:hypothetical protein